MLPSSRKVLDVFPYRTVVLVCSAYTVLSNRFSSKQERAQNRPGAFSFREGIALEMLERKPVLQGARLGHYMPVLT